MDAQQEVLEEMDARTLEVKMTVVTAIMSTVIFNESLDNLKDTDFYDSKLKQAGNQFEIQITNKCNKIADDLWQFNEHASSNLAKSIRTIAAHVAASKPSEIVAFAKMLNENKIKIS